MVNKHWLQYLMNVFEYFIFSKFIPNHFACFHDILKAFSCTQIKNLQQYYKISHKNTKI